MNGGSRLLWGAICILTCAFFACAIIGAITIGETLGRWAGGGL